MTYRIIEHPEKNFIAQLSQDGGLSWKSLLCYWYDKKYVVNLTDGLAESWGDEKVKNAHETIRRHKDHVRRIAITRVVHCE